MKSFEKETVKAQLMDEQKALKDLEKAYKQAKKDVLDNLKALNARPDMVDVQTVIHQKRYQETLLKQIDGVLNDLQSHTYKSANDFFQGSYQNGYIGSMYELMKQGIPITVPVNTKLMMTAIQTDSKLSKQYYFKKGLTVQNIRTLKQKIASEVTRGIASGKSWLEVAELLTVQRAFSISQSDAIRIIRTEGNRINQQGRIDAGDVAIKNGCDLLKQWDATLDSRTREAHREADGQIVEWSEEFTVMGEKLKAPCIGGSASNVINCRCQLLKRPRWALDDEELETLKERAKFYGLDKSESFQSYKDKFLKLPEKVPTVTFKVLQDAIDFSKLPDEDFRKWEDAYIKFNSGVDLTDEELELIEDYTEGGFSLFNGVDRKTKEQLLNEGFTEDQIRLYKERANQLSKVLSKYDLQTDIVTHRFERDVSWLTGNGNGVDELKKLIGQDRSFQGFASSSFGEMRARFTGGKKDAVHFEILTPKGTNGAYLFQSKKGELEFLYNRNTKFRILDGGERTVKETFFNINTMKMDERDIVERFLKIQVYPTKQVDEKRIEEFLKTLVKSNVTISHLDDIKSKLKRCKNTSEVNSTLTDYFNQNNGKLKKVDFSGASVEQAKQMGEKLVDLDDRFVSTLTEIKTKTLRSGISGQCEPTTSSCIESMTKQMNGDKDYKDVLESIITLSRADMDEKKELQYWEMNSKSSSPHNVVSDKDKISLNTLVHEYGHSILAGRFNMKYDPTFPPIVRAKAIYRRYTSAVKKLEREMMDVRDKYVGQSNFYELYEQDVKSSGLEDKLKSIYISKYGGSSVGEFIAESFCQVETSSNPSPYARQMYDELVKFFGKGKS